MGYCVYCHTNKINGKRYISITCQNLVRRWRNGLGYRKGAFHNALVKYGWDGFSHDILFSDLTEDDAKHKEKVLIAEYRTHDPRYGYNITEGGDGTVGYTRPPEQRLAMSISRKGRHAGNRNPMYGKSGEHSPHYGIPMTDEAKRLAGDAIRKRHREGNYNSSKKSVIAESETGFFHYPSIAEAARQTGIADSLISRVCRGIRKHAGGYVWRYSE